MVEAIKAFGYIRVSGKGQLDGDGFERQRQAINQYASANNIEIVRFFEERAVCGDVETMDRPAFLEMVTALMSNGVQAVVIEKLDRLSRNLMPQEACIRDFQKNGLTIYSTNEAEEHLMSDDPSRVLVRQIFAAIAQYDKSVLVAKMNAAKKRKKATGARVEGQKPFGSRPGEQAVLESLKTLRAEGKTYPQIAATMNERGTPARHGKWHTTSVRRVLTQAA
jgi:DNA invertase Pin-like site-specific DNA recombinase